MYGLGYPSNGCQVSFFKWRLARRNLLRATGGVYCSWKRIYGVQISKALYGLKQAPRAWYAKIDGYFLQHNYVRSLNEPTLYIKNDNSCNIIYVCLYADDIICTSSCDRLIVEFKEGMKTSFEMTDMGLMKYFLGLEVKQTKE